MDLSTLDKAVGMAKTPFYLFDTDAAAAQLAMLRAGLGREVKLCYAMKANPFLSGEIAATADFLEVCSPGEFRICELAGVPMKKIVLSGVCKRQDDLEPIFSRGLQIGTYTVESVSQWELLSMLSQKYGRAIHVLLRLTSGAQFGMAEADLLCVLREAGKNPLVSVDGIQYFSGTQKKSEAKVREEWSRLDTFLEELKNQYGFTAEKLEYGPGFPVDYFGTDPGLEQRMLNCLNECLQSLRWQGIVVLEMGREIAASCGCYITKVVDEKRVGSEHFAIVDGGIHQLHYDGQMIGMQTPPVFQLHGGGRKETWTVFGALCTKNDVLLKEHPFFGLGTGSLLVFEKAGAYSVTEGMALFLSRELPQVVLFSKRDGLRSVRAQIQTDIWNSPK